MTTPPTRTPNLFHLVLFFGLTVAGLVCAEIGLALLHPHNVLAAFSDQRLQMYANIATYLIALGFSALVFPVIWHRSFSVGLNWNPRAPFLLLVPFGIALGYASQALSSLLPMPKDTPMEKIFETPGIIWVLALFGILIAPLFEEIVFRGFLLPGIAIAVDYSRLPRSLEALAQWRLGAATPDNYSPFAIAVSTVITSLFFGLIHAYQLGYTWSAVALLSCVSLVLCAVRLRTHSVAASFAVHASYNFSVFLTLFLSTGGFRHMEKL
jgi:membrane protease YdiL (CAAX protease family)